MTKYCTAIVIARNEKCARDRAERGEWEDEFTREENIEEVGNPEMEEIS